MRFIPFLIFVCFFQIQCIQSESKTDTSNNEAQTKSEDLLTKAGKIQIDIQVKDGRMLREGWDETDRATRISEGEIDFFNISISSLIEKLLCEYQDLNCHDKNGQLNNKANWKDTPRYFSIQGEYDKTIKRNDVASYIYSELRKRELFQMDTLSEEFSIIEIIDIDTSVINSYIIQDKVWTYSSACSGTKPANEGGKLPPIWRSGKWQTHFKGGATVDDMIQAVLYDCFGIEFKIPESLKKNRIITKGIMFDFKVSDSFDEIKKTFLNYGIKIQESKEEKVTYIFDLK